MNPSTATPAQIDGQIAEHHTTIARSDAAIASAEAFLVQYAEAQGTYQANYSWFAPAKAAEAEASIKAAREARTAAYDALAPLNDEFSARGGWERYYLVTNTGGHVHWTTACNTCFPTTEFAWLTDYSGMARDAFVEEAGAKACTVCFPDAPVEVYSRATRIKYESAEAKARREEREAKAAAKAAAEVVVEGFVEYGGRPRTKTFKTVRAVTNSIAGDLSSLCWYGESHPTAPEWLSNIEACRKALAAKGAEYDYDKALAAARKKVTREGGASKF